ncbi:cell division protein FtsA [bacterium]|nr:cell division protein FtsA [bacterium]
MASNKGEITAVGLDIGTSRVVCLVGVAQPDSPSVSVVGIGIASTAGLRRGVVVDIEETVTAITSALEEAERMSGVVIERATVSVDGSHIQSLNSRGVIAVSRADKQISQEDMSRAAEAAAALSLETNREILRVIPRHYIVDGQSNIQDPFGMSGVRLEIDTHVLTASIPAMKNLDDAIHRAGITVNGHMIVPLAAARACLTKRQKELGVAVVNIGAETTGIAIFEEGRVAFSSILPVGSNHITKDIVYGLRTTIDIAEKMKLTFATARKPKIKDTTKLELSKIGAKGVLLQRELDMIVSSRLDEMCDLVKTEITRSGKEHLLSNGIVLTGGGAKLEGLPEYIEAAVGIPAALGEPQGITGIVDKVRGASFAVPVGLMLEDLDRPQAGKSINDRIGQLFGRAQSLFQGFLNRG